MVASSSSLSSADSSDSFWVSGRYDDGVSAELVVEGGGVVEEEVSQVHSGAVCGDQLVSFLGHVEQLAEAVQAEEASAGVLGLQPRNPVRSADDELLRATQQADDFLFDVAVASDEVLHASEGAAGRPLLARAGRVWFFWLLGVFRVLLSRGYG